LNKSDPIKSGSFPANKNVMASANALQISIKGWIKSTENIEMVDFIHPTLGFHLNGKYNNTLFFKN